MKLRGALLSFISLTSASNLPATTSFFANPDSTDSTSWKIPTIHESAVQARRIFHLENIGTLSTIFPSTHSAENRPADVGGTPIGLMDYFADCEPSTGNPTILAISIATSFKNVAAGSNITLSLRWHAPYKRPYSAAAVPRFSLVGHLEDISAEEVKDQNLSACFVRQHPDAVAWLPGNRIHESKWVRLVVEEIYWIGGFGDRAYIGWIPVEQWHNVTKEEIEKCRLPGETTGWGSWRSWLGFEAESQDSLEL
jgi:hypothetical protein